VHQLADEAVSSVAHVVCHLERVWFLVIGSHSSCNGGDDLAESKHVKQINNPILGAGLESGQEDRKSRRQRRIQTTNGIMGLLLVVVMEVDKEMD
jgi:hypothetical protein